MHFHFFGGNDVIIEQHKSAFGEIIIILEKIEVCEKHLGIMMQNSRLLVKA